MIIECTACTTRYDIKANIPQEGRTVRCAKCGHIWRAKPLPEEEPAAAAEPSGSLRDEMPQSDAGQRYEANPRAEASEEESGGNEGNGENNEEYFGIDSPFDRAEELAPDGRDYFSGAEAFSPRETEEGEGPEPEEEAGASAADDLQTFLPDWGNENAAEDGEQTKVSWFSTFLKRKNARAADEEWRDTLPSGHGAATPIPFPKTLSGADLTQPGNDLRTLEEAREAVRDVFASLEAKSPSGPSPSFQAAALDVSGSAGRTAPPEPQTPADGRMGASEAFGNMARWEEDSPASLDTGGNVSLPGWEETAASPDGEEPVAESHPWFKTWRDRQPDDVSDPDSQLRNALRAHFAERNSPAEAPHTPVEETGAPDDVIQQSIIERFAASWKRPEAVSRENVPSPEAASDEALDGGEHGASFDPQLYREIEKTQEQATHPNKREGRGGLALAAAWGLFLCVASGLVIGLFAFRDIAAGAIPGLAALYRSAGLPADVQPLAIESVQYEWTSEDFNPVLVIRGTVYNGGKRALKVPEFMITVKDNDPALDQEYPAELHLTNDEIAAGQRADFQIELQSPSPSITAVELELSHVH